LLDHGKAKQKIVGWSPEGTELETLRASLRALNDTR